MGFRRWFAAQVAAGVVRYVTGTALGAMLVIAGFDPRGWLAYLWANPPDWLDHPFVKIAIIVVGMAIIGLTLLLRRRSKRSIPIAFELRGQHFFSAQYDFLAGTGVWLNPSPKALVFSYGAVVLTNISPDRSVSLDFAIHFKGKNGQRGDFKLLADGQLGFGVIYGRTDSLSKAGRVDIFTNPTAIEPQKSIKANLVFLFSPLDETIRAEMVVKVVNGYFDIEILVTDRVSGITIAVPEIVNYRGR
jgi:hypothetical protein